jgi:NAD(P)-dependent dehydrogenase (short-subunit alcohol dehydrogenase family)
MRETLTGRLGGKTALITGSSRGLGRAIAKAYTAEGARVVINSRSAATAEAAAAEVGGGAIGIGADVSNKDGIARLVDEVLAEFGRLDILVNNAGMSMVRDSTELTLEEWQATLDLNLTGPFLCAQLAGRHMLSKGGGVILNISSITAFDGFPRRLAYATAKAGLVMMTKILAIEWAPDVRVNAIAPGFVETDFVLELAGQGKVDLDALRRRTPQGRLGRGADVAAAAVFLASDEASFITGTTLVTDGGWLAYGFV